ncbi:MAG TPA: CPBP family intramembrane glutamic endopeptidase, partial [Pyrinomonadaceae bacterium]|nr:CPBP family intramembrane glutamic endopeptidase [Pyrinomonadaceae bacterium]
ARRETVPAVPSDRALAGWEIASLVSSVLIAEWILSATAGETKLIVLIPVVFAFILVIGSHFLRGESFYELGFRFDNFGRALKLLALPMLGVGLFCVGLGLISGTRPNLFRWHPERAIAAQLALGFGWGFVQQYVLQSFINRRAQIIWQTGARSVLLTAFIFAFLHFPNPWLMLVTFIGGAVWAFVYQRAPNLFALAVSHAVMTWVLVSTLPMAALNHLRIGFKYFA